MATAETQRETFDQQKLESQWSEIQDALRKEVGDVAYRSWISPLCVKGFENNILQIVVPTRFIRDWVDTHYAQRIQTLWAKVQGPVAAVEFIIRSGQESASLQVVESDKTEGEETVSLHPANENLGTPSFISSELDSRFTFDQFVIGASNELAFAAAKRVAEQMESASFNPLFIKGGVGLGKTHLLHAIAWEIREQRPDCRVVYLTAEKFMYQFVKALRFKDTMTFKENFRSVDVLMIDDIQFIAHKGTTQEEFIHTFNALMDAGKQVVVTSNRSPAEIEGLDERLRSRLGWGLVAEIKPTTQELRRDILELKRKNLQVLIPNDVLDFLATNITASVRELEGALNRVVAHADLMGRPVTLATAEDLLQDLLRAQGRKISMEDIQRAVSDHYDIKLSDMLSARRLRILARPRQVAMYLCKQLTPRSLPEIGRKFGGRDHTTVIHAVRKIEELMGKDSALCDDIHVLKEQLRT